MSHEACYRTYNNAVNRGDLIRPKQCENCLECADRIQGHHEDHSRPLEVVWLCPTCHAKVSHTKREFAVKLPKLTKKTILLHMLREDSFFTRTSDALSEEEQASLYMRLNVHRYRKKTITEFINEDEFIEISGLQKTIKAALDQHSYHMLEVQKLHEVAQLLLQKEQDLTERLREKYGDVIEQVY